MEISNDLFLIKVIIKSAKYKLDYLISVYDAACSKSSLLKGQ
jgi:hypothetical protein